MVTQLNPRAVPRLPCPLAASESAGHPHVPSTLSVLCFGHCSLSASCALGAPDLVLDSLPPLTISPSLMKYHPRADHAHVYISVCISLPNAVHVVQCLTWMLTKYLTFAPSRTADPRFPAPCSLFLPQSSHLKG